MLQRLLILITFLSFYEVVGAQKIVVKNATIVSLYVRPKPHFQNEIMLLSKNFSYSTYIQSLTKMHPVMVYSLPNCQPCENAKLLLKNYYSDIPYHYLDTALIKGWHEKMYIDLQKVTGSPWFPYIFICGEYLGGRKRGSGVVEFQPISIFLSKIFRRNGFVDTAFSR